MKILLLNPPFKTEWGRFSREQRSPAITKSGTFYYPMWLCHAAGVLEQNGYEIHIIDAPATRMSVEDVVRYALNFKPTMLVVDTSTPSIENDVEIADSLAELTGAFTILVGTHPSALPERTLGSARLVHAIARREYEFTLLEVARQLEITNGVPPRSTLESIAGLSFRNGEKVIHNPDREFVKDLDALPFLSAVYRKHLNIRDYFYTIAQYPQVAILSARGCPNRCVYCVYPQVMHGRAYRARSVGNLIREFKYIEQHLPEVREIFVEDDTFTANPRRVQSFSQAYQREGLRISWIANSRADIDLNTLKALKACNCRLLCVGFESGDQQVLNRMGKNLSVDRSRRFIEDAKRVGILVHGCFMVGNPGETKESLDATLAHAKQLTPDTAQFFPIMVYPGTEAYDWAQENGYLLTEDFRMWNTEKGLHNCVVSRPGLSSEELVAFCDRARKEFYLRPRYILYRLARLLRHPREDGPRIMKSLRVFWRFLLKAEPQTSVPVKR